MLFMQTRLLRSWIWLSVSSSCRINVVSMSRMLILNDWFLILFLMLSSRLTSCGLSFCGGWFMWCVGIVFLAIVVGVFYWFRRFILFVGLRMG